MANDTTLSFIEFKVLKIVFDKGDLDTNIQDSGQFKVNIKFSCDTNEENKNDFLSSFIVSINHTAYKSFSFLVESYGKFMITGEADENVYLNLTEISAPSIVYPYIRSFVSTVFIQAGLNQFFIPSINFTNRRNFTMHSQIKAHDKVIP